MGESEPVPAPDTLTAQAALVPDQPAVIDPEGERRTFAELEALANRLAQGLAGLGLAGGDPVIWCGPNSVEVLIVLHAARKAGLVAVPLAYRFTADEMRYVIADSGAAVVLVDAEQAERIAAVRAELPAVREVVVFDSPQWHALLDGPAEQRVPLRAVEHDDLAHGGQLGADGGDALGLLGVDEHHRGSAVGDHVAHLVGREAVGQRHGDQARFACGVQHDEHLDAVWAAPDHRVAPGEAEARQALCEPVGQRFQLGERAPFALGIDHGGLVRNQLGLRGEGVGSGHRLTLAHHGAARNAERAACG